MVRHGRRRGGLGLPVLLGVLAGVVLALGGAHLIYA